MKRCLVKMSLISCCALMATQAFAQSATKAPAQAPKTQTAAAAKAKAAKPNFAAMTTTVTAAGSVILLADGIVANATIAPIQPPADGFVYER